MRLEATRTSFGVRVSDGVMTCIIYRSSIAAAKIAAQLMIDDWRSLGATLCEFSFTLIEQ